MPRIRKNAAFDHEDPAIGTFLRQLEVDVHGGRKVQTLPEELARTMLCNLGHTQGFDEEIKGDVAL